MSTQQRIGEVIRERRLALGYSLGQLATQLGKTPAIVRAWERGEDSPDPELTDTLLEALDLDEHAFDRFSGDGGEVEPAVVADTTEGEAVATDVPAEAVDEDLGAEEATAEEDADVTGDGEAEFSDAAATTLSVAADHEPVDGEDEPPVGDADGDGDGDRAAAGTAVLSDAAEAQPGAEEPTEAMASPVAAMTPVAAASGGYDVIQPVVAEAPPIPPITVPPLRLPNPIRLLFDPHRRYLYWIRYALTIVVLFILLRVFVWAGGELWTALGDFLDTFRATDSAEEEALRVILGS